jgi:hypothetical protein
MSGRRSHPRVVVSPAAQGSLRFLRDVVVQHAEGGEVVAISREPGTKGEVLAIELSIGQVIERLQCRVVESAPLLVDGNLRHRLRLTTVARVSDPVIAMLTPVAEHP